jgi:hypothetical protein
MLLFGACLAAQSLDFALELSLLRDPGEPCNECATIPFVRRTFEERQRPAEVCECGDGGAPLILGERSKFRRCVCRQEFPEQFP